ncbi:MAG: hypothetical protein CL840_11975 [Crocinitomicaceae bacterium]|nr:hypothetical protein [Crocinitomicaceae bacterium]|tara:strand:+ start:4752 stop:6251 length:1500 start_codon:yes stop_codon:yes gene_type:complete
MGTNIIQKQSLFSTIFNYLGVGIAYINLLFILPHFLTLKEIGVMRLIIEMATLFMLVFQFGSPYLVIRYFPTYVESEEKQRSFYTLAITFSILGIGMMSIFYWIFRDPILNYFSEKSSLISDYEKAFLVIAASLVLFNVFERIFSSKKIIAIPTFFKEFVYRVGLSVVAILIGIKLVSFSQGINIWMFFYLLAPIILLFLYKKKFGLKFNFNGAVWNKPNLRKYLGYASIVSLGAIGGGLSIKIDMIMTGSMLGPEQLTIYATMVYVATVIEIPKRALVQISDPFISEYYTEGKIDKIGALHKKNSVVLLVFGVFIFLGIYFNLPYLFQIMPKGESFALGINVFLIISGVKFMSLLSGISNQILLNSVEAWVSSVTIVILAFTSIVLNYYLIPIYGLEGAAFATLISVGINHALVMIYVYWKFRIHPFCKQIFLLFGFAVLLFLALIQVPMISNPYLGILITTSIISIVFPLAIWKLNISEDANQLLIQLISKIKEKVI